MTCRAKVIPFDRQIRKLFGLAVEIVEIPVEIPPLPEPRPEPDCRPSDSEPPEDAA